MIASPKKQVLPAAFFAPHISEGDSPFTGRSNRSMISLISRGRSRGLVSSPSQTMHTSCPTESPQQPPDSDSTGGQKTPHPVPSNAVLPGSRKASESLDPVDFLKETTMATGLAGYPWLLPSERPPAIDRTQSLDITHRAKKIYIPSRSIPANPVGCLKI